MGNIFGKKQKNSKKSRKSKKILKVEQLDQEAAIKIGISKLNRNKHARQMNGDELKEFALSLCTLGGLKEWYLNPEFAQTKKLVGKLQNVQNLATVATVGCSTANPKKSASRHAKCSKSTDQASSDSENDEDDEDEDESGEGDDSDTDFDFGEIEQEQNKPFMKIGEKIKVKLIIAEICRTEMKKAFRKFVSPILMDLRQQQKFGMFHSALVVGPWYLEWNNSSLCIPRKCYSSAAILAADLDKFEKGGFDLQETIDKVSKVIVDWNANKKYNQNKCNCQHFVDDLLKVLGIRLESAVESDLPLKEYLSTLRSRGRGEMAFKINNDIRESLKIQPKSKSFESHWQLDHWVNTELLEKDPLFPQKHPTEWGLLKSFDRAFWLRHFKMEKDERFMPLDRYSQHSGDTCCEGRCPFNDPTYTTSFKKEWW